MPRVKVTRSAGSDKPFLFEAFEEFLTKKVAVNTAEKTIANYKNSFEKFCIFANFDSGTEMEAVNPSVLDNWMISMREDGLKPNSINHYLRDLRTFLYWCMSEDQGYIEDIFKIPLIKGQEERPKTFEEEELEKLLRKPARVADFVEWRDWAIVNFVLGTGARAGSVCSITLWNVDFHKKQIVFPHTKNKSTLAVPMSSSLETALREYIRMWRRNAEGDSYLFPNISDEQLTSHALTQSFARYCKRRDVEKTSIHGLRHSFARMWIQNNGNVFKLQRILGHSTLEMTKKYVTLFNEDLKEEYDKYSALDTLKKKQKRTNFVKRTLDNM